MQGLDEVKKNTIFITTKEPITIENLINEMNKRADSNMHFKIDDSSQLNSAGIYYLTYRIVPTNNNIKKTEYEQQMKKFKSDLPGIARSFI